MSGISNSYGSSTWTRSGNTKSSNAKSSQQASGASGASGATRAGVGNVSGASGASGANSAFLNDIRGSKSLDMTYDFISEAKDAIRDELRQTPVGTKCDAEVIETKLETISYTDPETGETLYDLKQFTRSITVLGEVTGYSGGGMSQHIEWQTLASDWI